MGGGVPRGCGQRGTLPPAAALWRPRVEGDAWGPEGQSESKRRLLKDPRGRGREGTPRGDAPELLVWISSSPATLTAPLPQIHLITQSCWQWGRKVTLALPPRRPGPSSSPAEVAGRGSGGQGEGEGGCSGHRADTQDVGCHRKRWGGVPRREEGGARRGGEREEEGAAESEGGDCGGGRRREAYARVTGGTA